MVERSPVLRQDTHARFGAHRVRRGVLVDGVWRLTTLSTAQGAAVCSFLSLAAGAAMRPPARIHRKRNVTRPAGLPTVEGSERPAAREFIDSRHEGEPDYPAIQQSEEFAHLRRRLRLFVFPMSALFFCWYMTFALLSAYAHGFMSHKVAGEINTGTVLGLMQFVSTIMIVLAYRRFARKKLDPEVDRIRELAGVDTE
jgi:uncharacterized membrane protein (DUF485 family)